MLLLPDFRAGGGPSRCSAACASASGLSLSLRSLTFLFSLSSCALFFGNKHIFYRYFHCFSHSTQLSFHSKYETKHLNKVKENLKCCLHVLNGLLFKYWGWNIFVHVTNCHRCIKISKAELKAKGTDGTLFISLRFWQRNRHKFSRITHLLWFFCLPVFTTKILWQKPVGGSCSLNR